MDKIPIIIIGIVVAVGILFFAFMQFFPNISKTTLPKETILFYGDTCPHCKNVEDFIAKNDIKNKISFAEMEVYNNASNAQLLINLGKECKLDAQSIGAVPFLWDGSNCHLGDVDIIDFFKNAAEIE
jgi:glutaredoxin